MKCPSCHDPSVRRPWRRPGSGCILADKSSGRCPRGGGVAGINPRVAIGSRRANGCEPAPEAGVARVKRTMCSLASRGCRLRDEPRRLCNVDLLVALGAVRCQPFQCGLIPLLCDGDRAETQTIGPTRTRPPRHLQIDGGWWDHQVVRRSWIQVITGPSSAPCARQTQQVLRQHARKQASRRTGQPARTTGAVAIEAASPVEAALRDLRPAVLDRPPGRGRPFV